MHHHDCVFGSIMGVMRIQLHNRTALVSVMITSQLPRQPGHWQSKAMALSVCSDSCIPKVVTWHLVLGTDYRSVTSFVVTGVIAHARNIPCQRNGEGSTRDPSTRFPLPSRAARPDVVSLSD